jgi:TolA-binding protein
MMANRVASAGLVFALLGLTGCSWFGGARHAPPPQAAAPLPDLSGYSTSSTGASGGTALDDRLIAVQAEVDRQRILQQQQQLLQQQRQEIQLLQQKQDQQQQQIQLMLQGQNARNTGAPVPQGDGTTTASAAPASSSRGGGLSAYAPAFGWWHPGDPKAPSDYDKWDDESSREGNGRAY